MHASNDCCIYLGDSLAGYGFGNDHPFGPQRHDVFKQAFFDQGIGQQDLNIMMAVIMVFAIVLVAFNLLADLLYGVLDPRIRYD